MFGVEKCKKLHVGKTSVDFKCQDLFLDKRAEIEIKEEEYEEIKYKDVYDGENIIEQAGAELCQAQGKHRLVEL